MNSFRAHGMEIFAGIATLVLIANLQPEYAIGQSMFMKLILASMYLPLTIGIAYGALSIARRFQPLSTSVFVGACVTLSWCVFGLLSSFPIEPFGTNLPFTVASSLIVGTIVAVVVCMVGKAVTTFPMILGIAFLGIAALVNVSYWTYQGFAERPGNAGVGFVREREAVPGIPVPGEPGTHKVKTLTYGSGTDLHRAEYGAGVTIRSRSVSGVPFVPDQWSIARTGYWGFDETALPINGRVWYPEGDGPFPLVLILHGMCGMTWFSDGGFSYLGEMLASRGYIVASIDENFLNPGGYRYGDFEESDIDARGWLLLQHLRVWDLWNRDARGNFHGKIDMERIALIGHSRGGEAIAAAAAFNRMGRYPKNGNIPFDFHFGIRTLIAFAPSDITQPRYERSTPSRIENVNYLLLEGTQDRQVPSVLGSRVFQRVRFSDPGKHYVKSALYIGGANHSQFNSDWGVYDLSYPARVLTDMNAQLGATDQRDIAKTCVSVFLDATLKGDDRYLPLLRDHRKILGWLPKTSYVSRFEDSKFLPIAGFDEDIDLSTTTIPGGLITGEGLSKWREQDIDPRYALSLGSRANRVLSVGWEPDADHAPALRIDMGRQRRGLGVTKSSDFLMFSIAFPDATRTPAIRIRVKDGRGGSATLPMREIFPVPPAQRYRLTRLGFLETPSQVLVLQTVSIPLKRFVDTNPRFDPGTLQEVDLLFDRNSSGKVLLDDFGIDKT